MMLLLFLMTTFPKSVFIPRRPVAYLSLGRQSGLRRQKELSRLYHLLITEQCTHKRNVSGAIGQLGAKQRNRAERLTV